MCQENVRIAVFEDGGHAKALFFERFVQKT